MARKLVDRGNMFQRFLHSQIAGSLVLIVATVIALVWANSPWAATYFELSNTYLGCSFGDAEFKLSLSHWIKDETGIVVSFTYDQLSAVVYFPQFDYKHTLSVKPSTLEVISAGR